MYTASAADIAHATDTYRLNPRKSALIRFDVVGLFLAACAAAAFPHSEDASAGATAGAAAAGRAALSPSPRSHPPTRKIVIGTRKN